MHPSRVNNSKSDYTPIAEENIPLNDIPKNTSQVSDSIPKLTKIGKTVFGACFAAGMSVISWRASFLINEPDHSMIPYFTVNAVGTGIMATAFMGIGIVSRFSPKGEQNPSYTYTPGPLSLIAASCVGFPVGVKQQQDAAVPMWNNLTAENNKIIESNKGLYEEYKDQIAGCFDEVNDRIEEFTDPKCDICFDTITTTLDIEDYYTNQIHIVRFSNFTICAYPDDGLSQYWPYFATLNANQTQGAFPCGFPKIGYTAVERADRIILSQQFALYPPFDIEVVPLSEENCYNVSGYGVRPYFPLTYCRGLVPNPFPGVRFTCLTNQFFNYINNYTENFKPYHPLPELTIPAKTVLLAEEHLARDEYIGCAVIGTLSILIAIPTEFRQCYSRPKKQASLLTT
jgi:hypothetical protein